MSSESDAQATGASPEGSAPRCAEHVEQRKSLRPVLEQWIGIVSLVVHVLAIMFAVIEVLPHIIPEPALVWAMDTDETPGFRTVTYSFHNPSGSVPLQHLEAHWVVENAQVKLSVSQLAPAHILESPDPSQRIFKATGDLAGGATFKAYLHADEPFQVVEEDFHALVPKISQSSAYSVPAQTMTQQEWNAEERRGRLLAAGTGVLLLALMFGVSHVAGKLRIRLDVREVA